MLLAQFAGRSLTEIAIAIVVIAAIVALVFVALRQFNIAVPQWLVTVFWIVIAAVVIIFAIRLVSTL